MRKNEGTYEYGKRLIKELGDDKAYDLATWILYQLNGKNYCIWQTYTKDDIKLNWGKEPTVDEMDEMQENLMNCFDYIIPEEN